MFAAIILYLSLIFIKVMDLQRKKNPRSSKLRGQGMPLPTPGYRRGFDSADMIQIVDADKGGGLRTGAQMVQQDFPAGPAVAAGPVVIQVNIQICT